MFLHKVFEQHIDRDLMNLLFCTLEGRVLYILSLASRKGSLSMNFFPAKFGTISAILEKPGLETKALGGPCF